MKNKAIWLTLALVVTLTAVVPTVWEVDAAKAGPKIDKITVFWDTNMIRKELGQDFVVEAYKKMTGIELKVIQPPHNQYYEKLLIAFSSNELPDTVLVDGEHYLQFVAEGAIVPLDEIIAKSKVAKKINKEYIEALRLRNGKVYGFPLNQGGGTVTYIRKDWLDNLKLKVPKTYEELYEVMKAFTLNDPDKNGKNDTFGYTLPGVGDEMYMRDFYLDATHAFTYKDGKWIDGFSQPNFKAALERLKKAYQDKLLDKEVFTNKTSTSREKFMAGKIGIFNYWSGPWALQLLNGVKASGGAKAELVAVPALKGSFYYNRVAPIIAFTKACKNPEEAFKYTVELMYDGGKGQMLFTHGVEGIHWKKQGEEYIKLPSLANKNTTFGKVFIQPDLSLVKWNDPFKMAPIVLASRQVNIKTMVQQRLQPMSETYLKYGADLATLKEEIIAKVMNGQYSVDEGLKIYKEKSAALGLDKMLTEFNK